MLKDTSAQVVLRLGKEYYELIIKCLYLTANLKYIPFLKYICDSAFKLDNFAIQRVDEKTHMITDPLTPTWPAIPRQIWLTQLPRSTRNYSKRHFSQDPQRAICRFIIILLSWSEFFRLTRHSTNSIKIIPSRKKLYMTSTSPYISSTFSHQQYFAGCT